MRNNISFESQSTLKNASTKTDSESSLTYSITGELLTNCFENNSIALSYEVLIGPYLQFQNKNNEMEKFSNEIEQENIYLLFQDNIKKIIKFNHSERIDLILNEILNYDENKRYFNINANSKLMSKIAYLVSQSFMKFINNKNIKNFFYFLTSFNFISEEMYNFRKINNFNLKNSLLKNSISSNYSFYDNKKDIKKIKIKNLEMLKNKFSFIQKIKISLPYYSISPLDYNNYLFFLFNYQWIFENVKEIEIDFTCLFIFSDNGKNLEREDDFYKLIIAIFYFLNKLHDYEISSLKIIIPFTFSKELNHYLSKSIKKIRQDIIQKRTKNEKLIINKSKTSNIEKVKKKFQLLQVFDNIFPNINSFSMEFNSIDCQSFENLNNFLSKNNQIQVLDLRIFPFTTESNFSIYLNNVQLKKICEINQMIEKNSFETIIKKREYINNDEINYYLDLLSIPFDKNLKDLFSNIEESKNSLNNLMIDFTLPEIIVNKENYTIKIINFIIDLFGLLNSNVLKINSLELNSSNLILDSDKYLYINEKLLLYILKLGMNKTLKTLNFNFKIFNFENLIFLIPINIVSLSLGKLCYITTKNFIHDLKYLNKLGYLSFSIFSQKESLEKNYELLKEFIITNNLPTSLIEINVNCLINISYEKIKDLINQDLIKNRYIQNLILNFDFDYIKREKLVSKNLCQRELNDLIKKNEKQFNYISSIKSNFKESIIRIFNKKIPFNNNENNEIKDILTEKTNSINFCKIFKNIYMFLGKTKSKSIKINLN